MAAMTASSRSAAAPASILARWLPSWRADPAGLGLSRTSATGGPAPTRRYRADRRGADHGRHRLGSRPRQRHHQFETHVKKIIFHPKVLPSVVICDPELTVGMPKTSPLAPAWMPSPIASKPIPAPHFHPMSQGIALEGMRLVKEYLPRAYADGTDIEARGQMMVAAPWARSRSRRGSAPFMRCRIRWARSTTPITAPPTPW
jgi:hypothetical protein